MGVTGLWRLIEPAGKPVPIETLENKVLAVDISIWLHQMVKGFQDAKGAPMPNAHLLGLFQRLCKLLYFRIKPVFVFDGSYPELKKETIAKRQDNKAKLNSESERLKREILLLLGKQTAIGSLLGKQTSPKKAPRSDNSAENDDLFKLPDLPAVENEEEKSSNSESEEEEYSSVPVVDLHSIDLESENFKNLPLREKHDVLIELKETRKMNSWGKLHELPKNSDNFSDYQMKRLLKRRKVQECLEETEKEIGQNSMTLNELQSLLNDQGVITDIDNLPTKRIASDDKTRYLLISNVKQAIEDAKQKELEIPKKIETGKVDADVSTSKENSNSELKENDKSDVNFEPDEDLEKAIKMSLEFSDDNNKDESKIKESFDSSNMVKSDCSDTSEDEVNLNFDSAKAYMEQNTDYTSKAISKIVSKGVLKKVSKHKSRLSEILKELEISSSQESETIEKNWSHFENLYEKLTLQLSSSDDDDDDDVKKTTLISSSTNEKESIALNRKSATENTSIETVEDSNESEEEFEEVPETTSEKMCKPVVEVNLEFKETLEDDIFADIFENESSSKTKKGDFGVTAKYSVDSNNLDIPTVNEIVEIKDDLSNSEKQLNECVMFGSRVSHTKSAQNSCETDYLECNISNIIKGSDKKILVMSSTTSNSNVTHQNDETKLIMKSEAINMISSDLNSDKADPTKPFVVSTENDLNNTLNETNNEVIKSSSTKVTSEELIIMADQLNSEREDLVQEKNRLERMGRNISEQMTKDAQELLQIFGIPYIVAPCEAEAQCAFLESVELTDGTITDDSDIWLFGGRTVYKNFFNQKKLVMQFLSERIDKSFNLSREQLVLLALLVGSDYTAGVSGVGPVTALEILASFACSRKDLLMFHAATNPQAKYSALLTGLQEFKKWVRSGRKTDDTSLRKKLRNVSVGDDFPSIRVVQAYMEPKVETSREKFTWGEPDLTVLTDYVKKKFGWSKNKLDEIMNPVLKRLQERNNQKTMQDYFKRTIQFQNLDDQMSKRVQAAVKKMGDETTEMKPPEKPVKKRKITKKPKQQNTDGEIKCTVNVSEPILDIINEPSTSKCDVGITKVISSSEDAKTGFDIVVPKLDRYQEIIPQREKDRINVLKTKLKAIEMYRKSKLDQKSIKKRRPNLPKQHADLSESSDSE